MIDQTAPPTLRHVLLGEHDQRDLRTATDETGATGAIDDRLTVVAPGFRAAARDEILDLIAGILDQSLADLLARGWRTWERLEEQARSSLETPGSTQVELLNHEVTSSHRPRVDVIYGGKEIARIEVAIDATILLHAVTAVLSGGRMTSLRTGRADVSAALAIQGVTVLSATRTLELPVELPLGAGIVLVSAPDVVTLPPSEPAPTG